MKEILKIFLYGILSIILVTLCEFLVTLPFGNPWDTYEPFEISAEVYGRYLNIEFLLTAIPAGIIIFLLLKLSKSSCTSSMKKGHYGLLCFV